MESRFEELARELGRLLQMRGLKAATAESCTGGGIAYAITSVAGSSEWFDQGLVTYSNEAKEQWLGVPAGTLSEDGAVSEATVRAMVEGLIRVTRADLGIAVSGIAGPGGGTLEKPVGLVWLAWNLRGKTEAHAFHFEGTRGEIRRYSIEQALRGAIERLEADKG